MQPELIAAYRYWRQRPGYNSGRTPFEGAAASLARARADVAAGLARYPYDRLYPPAHRQDDGSVFVEVDRIGLRHVGNVAPEVRKFAHDIGGQGWYTDPDGFSSKDGTGLCWGVVYQLPGAGRSARFVAGYVMGGCDNENPTLDLAHVFTSQADWTTDPREFDGARDAAHAADSMAQRAAEQEREYQTAWRAGTRWADLGEGVKHDRLRLLAILGERRQVKGVEAPNLCAAIRDQVESLLESIREARETRTKLAEGDAEGLMFWPGEARLKSAFNDGAGDSVFKLA